MNKYGIAPRNTYNLDETGFLLGIGAEVKRITREIRHNPQFKEAINRESYSVIESICTDGFNVTPLIIFKGKNTLAGWFKNKKNVEYWYGHAIHGYNNSQLCLKYLKKIFEPETHIR